MRGGIARGLRLAALATALAAAPSFAHDFALPPDAAASFQVFVRAANASRALGPNVAIASLTIDEDRVRLRVTGPGPGDALELVLLHREAEPAALHSEHFALEARDPRWAKRAATLQAVITLLDATFGDSDPWIELPPPMAGRTGWGPRADAPGLELPLAHSIVTVAALAVLALVSLLLVAFAGTSGQRAGGADAAEQPPPPRSA